MFSRVRSASGGVGWVGGGGGGDNVRWNIHTSSMLHVFQGTQGIWWGGLGGVGWAGGGRGGDNVRWNIHTSSMLHVFQGTQGIWWGGLGGVGCNNMTFWFWSLSIDYPWE